jgi:hypothetical protein
MADVRFASRLALGLMLSTSIWSQALAGPFDGDWEGVLQAGAQRLRAEVHIESNAEGLAVVLDSLDQGASIPATAAKIENGELNALFLSIAGELRMRIGANPDTLVGAWIQGPTLPLTLTRKATPAK